MRSILLAIILSSACAAPSTVGPRGAVNVAVVRREIWETMKHQENERSIQSMGKVTPVRAVVYTVGKSQVKQEETWVKQGDQWHLETATSLDTGATKETTSAR